MKKVTKGKKILSHIWTVIKYGYLVAWMALATYEIAETSHMRLMQAEFMRIQVSYMQWQVNKGIGT